MLFKKPTHTPHCNSAILILDDHHNRRNVPRKVGASGSGVAVTTKKARTAFSEWDESAQPAIETGEAKLATADNDLDYDISVAKALRTAEANQNDIAVPSKNHKHRTENIAMENNIQNGSDLPRSDLQLGEEQSYTVILREHESQHHGHSHTHGHVHSAPDSLSSVAWMVIMGDGLHNFTDGMAIGAAFASGIAGGFSTSVAVFCHELPHEIGDFAVLLKAGMSAKQAMFYNILSSILCFFGCVLGIAIGHIDVANDWVFAAAGGMFIYIALVDMVSEKTSIWLEFWYNF